MSVKNENAAGGESVVLERPAAGGVYASLFEKINLSPVSELSALDIWQDAQAMSDATADERLTAGMQVFLECLTKSGSRVEKLDKNLIDHHIAELDWQISRQLDAVMHHEDFQAVESLWRGVKSLVDKTDFRQNVKVELLDMSKEDLRQDFEDSPEIIQSGLYKHTYIDEYDTPGGEPIAALISAYEFDASAQDVTLLRNISKVSAAAHMPFIGSAGPKFFLKDNMEEVAAIRDIGNYFDRAEYIKWKSFRETDDARYIGLVMPRVLGRLPYGPDREPSALHDGAVEAVWDARVWHNTVTGSVATRDYNYRTATTPMDARVSVRNDAATTGEHYRYAAPYREAGDDTTSEPETESGAFYARIHHERELNRAIRLHLFSNASHLTPGMVLEAGDSDVPELKEGMVITLTTFHAARDTRLHVSVWGMPYSEQFCFRPKTAPRPVIAGTLMARVESEEKNDPYAHLDEQGRYRVKLDFSREDAEAGYNYLWIRQAKPYAGETYGWHTPLIDGTEVGIAFDGGDPDRPYIAHAFHDSEHADVVTRDNRSQNILRTAGRNELRMEDQRQAEHIALNTPFGATALNQGHVVDARNEPRGTGFELRTDEFGVIRVAKGLLVTATGQTKAEGDVLSMDEALREIDMGRQRLALLADAERQALALEADVASQIAMFSERLKPLNEVIHFTAPEGMAFTSDEHLQLTATDNIAINAGGDISTGSLGNTALLAGQTLGLFAQSGKLGLISDQGPVQVQAQNGALHMSAAQKLSISSMSDILFAGKKKVTLIGGGSYVKIEAGGIEYGTPHTYTRNIKRTLKLKPASQPVEMPALYPPIENKICIPCLLKAIQGNDAIVQGA